jgi:hypothetical protein
VSPRPTTHDPRPTTHDPRPTTHDPRPTTHDPRPTTHDPRPTAHGSRLTAHGPTRETPREPGPETLPSRGSLEATNRRSDPVPPPLAHRLPGFARWRCVPVSRRCVPCRAPSGGRDPLPGLPHRPKALRESGSLSRPGPSRVVPGPSTLSSVRCPSDRAFLRRTAFPHLDPKAHSAGRALQAGARRAMRKVREAHRRRQPERLLAFRALLRFLPT